MSVYTYLDLCTGHLRCKTMQLLSSMPDCVELGWPAMTIAPYEYGVFVTVPDFHDSEPGEIKNLPKDLRRVLWYAHELGMYVVRFDSAAPNVTALKHYEW